jgi:hypothetical protein
MWFAYIAYPIYQLSPILALRHNAACPVSSTRQSQMQARPSRRAFFRFDMHTAILTTALIHPANDASGPAACRRR